MGARKCEFLKYFLGNYDWTTFVHSYNEGKPQKNPIFMFKLVERGGVGEDNYDNKDRRSPLAIDKRSWEGTSDCSIHSLWYAPLKLWLPWKLKGTEIDC